MITEPIIDVHSHALLPIYTEAQTGAKSGVTAMPGWSADGHIAMMDRHGIAAAVLSTPELADLTAGAVGHARARAVNEELARIVAEHPGRFGAFAVVPMDDMDAANEEMAYALDVLKLDGVCTGTQYQGLYLGDPRYEAWFAEMDRRGATLFVHPGAPPGFDAARSRINVSVLEFMFETTRMVTSLVLSGAKARFGGINIITTHGGGTIPYLAHRISISQQMPWAFRDGSTQSVPEAFATLGSFFFDLTAADAPAQLDALQRLVPAERLVLGFDYPMMPEQTVAPAIEAVGAHPGFSEADLVGIAHANARRLLPRLAQRVTTAVAR